MTRFTACSDRLIKKQCLLLTSTLKTPETTTAFQQSVLEVATGASPHCYDVLKLTFGNTIGAIKRERQKIADERKALQEIADEKARQKIADEKARQKANEEAKKQAEIETARLEELMSRPMLKCSMTQWGGGMCGEVSIQDNRGNACPHNKSCSKCGRIWGGAEICGGCDREFR